MHAAVVESFGQPLVITSLPEPEPARDEVVVRVERVAVNRTLDVEVHQSGAGWGVAPPLVTGADPAGIIEEVGSDVTQFHPGDRVAVFPFLFDDHCPWCRQGQHSACDQFGVLGVHRLGGDAQRLSIPARNCFRLPDTVSFDHAAAASLTYGVAVELLIRRAQIKAGETILIWGGAGGEGSAAIDISQGLGARIIAVGSSPERLAFCRELGADETINRRTDAVAEAIGDMTHGRGVDVVLENIGQDSWQTSLGALGREGRLVTSGVVTGAQAAIDIRALYRKHVGLWFSAGFGLPVFSSVIEGLASGRYHPAVTKVARLAEADQAQSLIVSNHAMGRILLDPQAR